MSASSIPPNDVDQLLTAYFRSEMPTPWPRWRRPKATVAPVGATTTLSQSRTVLTASLAALVAGLWLVAAWRPTPPTPDVGLQDGTATRPAHWRLTPESPAKNR